MRSPLVFHVSTYHFNVQSVLERTHKIPSLIRVRLDLLPRGHFPGSPARCQEVLHPAGVAQIGSSKERTWGPAARGSPCVGCRPGGRLWQAGDRASMASRCPSQADCWWLPSPVPGTAWPQGCTGWQSRAHSQLHGSWGGCCLFIPDRRPSGSLDSAGVSSPCPPPPPASLPLLVQVPQNLKLVLDTFQAEVWSHQEHPWRGQCLVSWGSSPRSGHTRG